MKRFLTYHCLWLILLLAAWGTPGVAQTKEVFNNYNSNVECSLTDKAAFTLREALNRAMGAVWYDFGKVPMEAHYTLTRSGKTIGSGVVRKGDCAKGYTWCSGLMDFGDLQAGTYTVTVSPGRICHNPKNDGGNGFIRVSGTPKGTGSVTPGKGYWRLTGVTVPDQYNLKSPWSGSVSCHSCVEYSWSIPRDPTNNISTQRRMCSDCWGLKKGQTWSGHAAWAVLPNILVPETKIPVSIEVSSGQFNWQGVTPTVTANAGQPPVKKTFEFRVPHHGAYTDLSQPTHTWPISFTTSCLDAKGNVQMGDPSLTIYFTYEWVGP